MCQVAFTDGLGGEKEMTGCKGGTCVTVSLRNLNFCVHNHNLGLSMKGWKGKSQRGMILEKGRCRGNLLFGLRLSDDLFFFFFGKRFILSHSYRNN